MKRNNAIHVHHACAAWFIVVVFALGTSCTSDNHEKFGQERMVEILKGVKNKKDKFNSSLKLVAADSLLALSTGSPERTRNYLFDKANILVELGREAEAIAILEPLARAASPYETPKEKRSLAVAYLRQGERSNCIMNHAAESCILPIRGLGIYDVTEPTQKAIAVYKELLAQDSRDLESRWLLNIAYMTLGEYPEGVPPDLLIPNLYGDTSYQVKPFADIASSLNVNLNNMAGSSVLEDFNNDGNIDLMTSGWGAEDPIHLFVNNGAGSFVDQSDRIGLNGITGGLNMVQADYNNDGFQDVLVLRGAWKNEYGDVPNSLLKNNGDGTFTDVTIESGLLSFHPTQTATWNDFNNDGWLDLFIGNESELDPRKPQHPSELFMNNHDGTFREVAERAGCKIVNYVKGVTSGDYDNDGWQDIFISTMDGTRMLLRNKGRNGDNVAFENVTRAAHLDDERNRTFPAWFWDYDNDGWLDIFTCDYTLQTSLAYCAAAERLGLDAGSPDKILLYKNNGDGTFRSVAADLGLNKTAFAMGANFGDINNDGFLDIYLGTGNPPFQAVIPNKMFLNIGGREFADVTTSARVGHLQKGHAVSFADIDNDGDQDIHIDMGGPFSGDTYQSSLFLNPGQNNNNWISLQLEGVTSNKAAIGSRIAVTFKENGKQRTVYRDVNSGGSFGASPLRQAIGIGTADHIDRIEIEWPGAKEKQVITDVTPKQFLKIREGEPQPAVLPIKPITWILPERLCYPDGTLIY